MMSIRNDHRGIMTPLPPSWVLPTALQTTLIPDGEQTPEGVTGLLNTADLLDKIAQLQAQVRQPPGLSLQEVDESGSETGAEAFAFAPPAPHPVARPAKVGLQAAPMAELKAPVRSLGTMGHPFACASPCRYVKRKGGCRDGADCPNCHECFWTKSRGFGINMAEALPFSEGTRGHPDRCAEACKYVRRKGGCRDGENCPKCHSCQWRRDGAKNLRQDEEAEAIEANVQTPGLRPTAEDVEEEHQKLQYEHLPLPQIQKLVAGMESLEMFPSMGSLGHPFTCASPCRHFLEGNCQDGALCAFCHRCNPMSLQSTPLACGQRFYL